VKLNTSGKEQLVVPFLFSTRETYDVQRGGEFFAYLDFKLVPVERNGAQFVAVAGRDGPELIDVSATNYLSHVGSNTPEIFHADEVLAANFALALGYRAATERTPEIPKKLAASLSSLK